jgi:5'-3' exonuclease
VTSEARLFLVDGSSNLYRAFHALPPLSNTQGLPTHATLGFTSMLLKLLREDAPEALAVAFDGPGPTVRHHLFTEYKANRPPMPDALAQQIPSVHQVLQAMRVPVLMVSGEEADDILASAAVRAAGEGFRVVLLSGDKDLLQVVDERIVVRDTMKGKTWGQAEVEQRYGVSPRQFPELLALTGDSIDNIPGVPGVGDKTARDLLQRFGSLEAVLERAGEIASPKLREAVRAHAEQIRLSMRLATIRTDLPLPWGARDFRRTAPDVPAVLALFRELGFARLAEQFSQPAFFTEDPAKNAGKSKSQ